MSVDNKIVYQLKGEELTEKNKNTVKIHPDALSVQIYEEEYVDGYWEGDYDHPMTTTKTFVRWLEPIDEKKVGDE